MALDTAWVDRESPIPISHAQDSKIYYLFADARNW